MKETEYWHRTDTFEQKLDLLKVASKRRDFRLARALTESLKNTLLFAQQEEESLGVPLLRANVFGSVAELPPPWQEWARGWLYYKVLALDETAALARTGEPVELVAAFRADQTESLAREVPSDLARYITVSVSQSRPSAWSQVFSLTTLVMLVRIASEGRNQAWLVTVRMRVVPAKAIRKVRCGRCIGPKLKQ